MPKKKHKADPFYSTQRWKETRRKYRAKHCEACGASGSTARLVLDHIAELRDIGKRSPLAYDPNNLQTLCFKCHAKKTALAKSMRDSRQGTYQRQPDKLFVQPMEVAMRRKRR